MRLYAKVFKAFFALLLLLCLFAGCASADNADLPHNRFQILPTAVWKTAKL